MSWTLPSEVGNAVRTLKEPYAKVSAEDEKRSRKALLQYYDYVINLERRLYSFKERFYDAWAAHALAVGQARQEFTHTERLHSDLKSMEDTAKVLLEKMRLLADEVEKTKDYRAGELQVVVRELELLESNLR